MTGEDRLRRFQAGDPEAFEEVVQDMGPRLLGFFRRLGAPPGLAEDLVQDVFLRVLQRIDRYRPSGRADAWLLRIARNLWIDHRRRRRPAASLEPDPELPDPGEGPRERAERGDRASAVRFALAALPEDTRELLELAVLQRLPYREVAGILGIPEGTVKSRVFYALRRLREECPDLEEA